MNGKIQISEMSTDELIKSYKELGNYCIETGKKYNSKQKQFINICKMYNNLLKKYNSICQVILHYEKTGERKAINGVSIEYALRYIKNYKEAIEKTEKEMDFIKREEEKLRIEYEETRKKFLDINREIQRRGIIIEEDNEPDLEQKTELTENNEFRRGLVVEPSKNNQSNTEQNPLGDSQTPITAQTGRDE